MVTFWPRISTVLLLVTLLAVIGLFATRAFGDPLDPPGPPASTPGGIDGRIPISSLPFPISTSGSYVVTKNLTLAGANGITVSADNVTIDLNGFMLDGVNQTAAGVFAESRSNLSVVNGVIRRWGDAIYNHDPTGPGSGGLFRGLQITNNVVGVTAARGAKLDASIVRVNTTYGVRSPTFGITVTNSTFLDNPTAIDAGSQALIESNHIEIPVGGIGVAAGNFTTIRHNYFGHSTTSGYTTIALGTAAYVVAIENRMKASLTTGTGSLGAGEAPVIIYDANHALTNISP